MRLLKGVIDMTNRDKMLRMSNAELADILHRIFGEYKCKFCCYTREGRRGVNCFGKSCFIGIKMWLSASCANESENHDIEVLNFIEDKQLGFHLGNAVKYISRAGRKDPARTVEDLRKAVWYISRQIGRLERMKNV